MKRRLKESILCIDSHLEVKAAQLFGRQLPSRPNGSPLQSPHLCVSQNRLKEPWLEISSALRPDSFYWVNSCLRLPLLGKRQYLLKRNEEHRCRERLSSHRTFFQKPHRVPSEGRFLRYREKKRDSYFHCLQITAVEITCWKNYQPGPLKMQLPQNMKEQERKEIE